MPQSLAKILIHIVFSTKNRTNLIPQYLLPEMHAYLATACRNFGCEAYRVGGIENHIHIACRLERTVSASQLIKEIKQASSKWIKDRDALCDGFAWQAGYGIFSVGFSQFDELIRYIDNQKEHHQAMSFQEEFLDFLKKYRIEYDEKYLWD